MQAIVIRHVVAGALSILFALYFTPIIILAARKTGFLDKPDNKLKKHKEPTPYLGGVAVFIPFIASLGICYPFDNDILWLLIGSSLLLFVGLIDDFKVLSPRQKFFGQCIASLCFFKGQFSLKTEFFLTYWTLPFSLLWMLTVINAFNLVDVMDGLCSLLAFVAACGAVAYALLLGDYQTSLFFTSLGGALLGFLWYNKPQARIYLGDAGSLFLGGIFAALPLLFKWPEHVGTYDVFQTSFLWPLQPLSNMFLIPTLLLIVPLLEVCALFVIRTSLGISFYTGSPHHFALYLLRRGWTKWHVLGAAAFFALLSFCIGILFLYKIALTWALLMLLALCILWLTVVYRKG